MGVDPVGRDAEGEGQLDVPVAVGVDESVHAAGRGGRLLGDLLRLAREVAGLDQDQPVPGHRAFHLLDPQHVDPPNSSYLTAFGMISASPSVRIRLAAPSGLAHVNPLLKISCREAGHYPDLPPGRRRGVTG
jgi:hypothetical protein